MAEEEVVVAVEVAAVAIMRLSHAPSFWVVLAYRLLAWPDCERNCWVNSEPKYLILTGVVPI
jgi:hypothetical protein